MGVLLPSESEALEYSTLPMGDVDGFAATDAASSGSCEVSSPEGTPAPSEHPCVFDRRFLWPPDPYSPSQYQYIPPTQQSSHLHGMAATGLALGMYTYHS